MKSRIKVGSSFTTAGVESAGEIAPIDLPAPADKAVKVWRGLDARVPGFLVVLKPDHAGDGNRFKRRLHRGDWPDTAREPIEPGIVRLAGADGLIRWRQDETGAPVA